MAAPAKLEIQSVEQSFLKRFGFIIGVLVLLGIVLIPIPEGLPIAGHRMLAILVFSVIIWMTDTISYPASAAVIMALMAFLVGINSL